MSFVRTAELYVPLKAELEAILVTMSKDKQFISIVTETLNPVADLIEKEL